MKKVLSSLVAALVAVAFAGVVFAADMPAGHPAVAPAAEVKKEEKAPVKKTKKAKKAKKAAKTEEVKKEEAAPAAPAAK